ncbi:MAG: universal stress protein [Betaproteobacteria bacterium]|nr:universal stress protein [Betaproteobacteria bacterium]
MPKILAPIDGSHNASRVIDYLVQTAPALTDLQIVLINVREPINVAAFGRALSPESPDQAQTLQQEEGGKVLQPAAEKLTRAGIRHTSAVLEGDVAPTIADHAVKQGCDMIVIGNRGMGAIANLLMGSVATKVIRLAAMPVTLIK